MNYRKAFGRHDQERYAAYLKAVEKGDAKINAGAVYPYEILRSIIGSPYRRKECVGTRGIGRRPSMEGYA